MTTARLLPAYCEPEATFCSLLHMPAGSGRINLIRQPSVLNYKSAKVEKYKDCLDLFNIIEIGVA
jgi:hypothetical protein